MKKIIAGDVGYGNTKVVWNNYQDKLGKYRWGEKSLMSIAPCVVADKHKSVLIRTYAALIGTDRLRNSCRK